MLPTISEALKELEIAGTKNPGPWTKHSENTGLAARNIAEKLPGMDVEKAYILGLLHDIGRGGWHSQYPPPYIRGVPLLY